MKNIRIDFITFNVGIIIFELNNTIISLFLINNYQLQNATKVKSKK